MVVLLLILAFDLLIVFKRPHIPSPKESTLWVSFYVALALLFALAMLLIGDAEHAGTGGQVTGFRDGPDGPPRPPVVPGG